MKKDIDNYIFKIIGTHSPGYVIDIHTSSNDEEYVYGSLSKDSEDKVNSSTLYDIASLTKTFTAVLVYKAIQDNLLKLEDNVYDIDNNFINLKDIKIIDLLSHRQNIWTTSHLKEASSYEDFYKILYTAYVKEKERTYVDLHYIILSTILEKIYGKSYKELVFEYIKKPLKLDSLTFEPRTNNIACTNYEVLPNGIVNDNVLLGEVHDIKARTAVKYGIYVGHAGIFINGKDLMCFLKSFLDYSILKKETIDMMIKHDDINKINYELLLKLTDKDTTNNMFEKIKDTNPKVFLTYNYSSMRYRNDIEEYNEIPNMASNNSVYFSGYTGPSYLIDFDRKIIISVMCNVVNKNTLPRFERKKVTNDIIKFAYDNVI